MTQQTKNGFAKHDQHYDVTKRKQQVLQIMQLYFTNWQIMKYRYILKGTQLINQEMLSYGRRSDSKICKNEKGLTDLEKTGQF